MVYLWIGIICSFSVSLTNGYHITYECNNGVECLALENCTGLYGEWQGENKKDLENNLIAWLLCEKKKNIIDKTTKVCCPADVFLSNTTFKARVSKDSNTTEPNVTTINSNSAAVETYMSSTNSNITTKYKILCGVSTVDKIYGGENTQIDEYPWMALLAYKSGNKSEYFCGGVLISSRYILTAAHCVNSSSLEGWTLTHVRLGEWKLSENPDCYPSDNCNHAADVTVEEAVVHESFKPNEVNFHNDIALLRLTQDVEFTDFVRPICLPTGTNLTSFEGGDVYVAGWGKTPNSPQSDVKLQVSLPIVNQTECVRKYKDQARSVTSMQLCAGGVDGKDSCKGDSGGSLMGQMPSGSWLAIGVVSYGPNPCGSIGWPGIYTRVSSYIQWIQTNMQA